MSRVVGRSLGAALIAEGLCPPHALNVELHIPANGVTFIRYDVYVDRDDCEKLKRALAKLLLDAHTPTGDPS